MSLLIRPHMLNIHTGWMKHKLQKADYPVHVDYFDEPDDVRTLISLEFELPEGKVIPKQVIQALAVKEGWPDLETALAEIRIPQERMLVIPPLKPHQDPLEACMKSFEDDTMLTNYHAEQAFEDYLDARTKTLACKQPAAAPDPAATAPDPDRGVWRRAEPQSTPYTVITPPSPLWEAILLAHCGEWNYRPDLPPLFTRKRLHRSCRLITIDGSRFYGLDKNRTSSPSPR